MRPSFKIDGVDTLSAKAYLASLIGPRRAALGARHKVMLPNFNPVKIASNTGTAGVDRACFVAISLGGGQGVMNVPVLFGSDSSPSDDNGVLVSIGAGIGSSRSIYEAVLYPGEMLFAALPSDVAVFPGVVLPISLVVSQEWF